MTSRRLRVLILEDFDEDAQLLLLHLRQGGFEPDYERIDSIHKLTAALAGQPWDIVLSDYHMPQFSGRQALQIVKEKDPAMPFILISGTVGEEFAVEAMRLGADDYITKNNMARLVPAVTRELSEAANRRSRKQTETALKESEYLYRTLFEQARDSILMLEVMPEGPPIIRDANAAALQMRGFQREELLGKPISFLDAELESTALVMARLRQLQAPAGAVFEVKHRRKDGSVLAAEASARKVTLGGKPMIIDISRDITERRNTEEALATMQKLESLGTLAGGIAHDFNNLLTAIIGNLSLLRSKMESDDASLELIQEAQEACQTAKDLSHQLLTFAKGGSPVRKILDLRPVLKHAAGFATRGSNARCIFNLGESALSVNIDKGQVSQVLQNIVINAVQAMPTGGTITVEAAPIVLKDKERPPLEAGRYVRVKVSDQGPGIPVEHLTKIFDPYFSTKAKGRGLGLAVCHSIMTKHGGVIFAEPDTKAGATFTLYFPAANATGITSKKAISSLTTGRGTVLVMDDEALVARILKRMIEHLGYKAECVADGAAALDAYGRAMKAGAPYDAVIMDLTIPGGMGGKEAVAKLKRLDPNAKVIVSSGYSDDPIMSAWTEHGFSGVLPKPNTFEDVSEVLREVICNPSA